MSSKTQVFIPIKLFYCYAREDQPLRDELAVHLEPLHRAHFITSWHDGELLPGTSWEREIFAHLETADVILLLVSAAFFKSDYCYSIEMQRAIERHYAGQACVLPILIRPVHWEDAPFAQLQMLPDNAHPITSWPNRDEAFVNVVKGVRRVINDLRTQRMEFQRTLSAPTSLPANNEHHPHRKSPKSFLATFFNDLFRRRQRIDWLELEMMAEAGVQQIMAMEATQRVWAQNNQALEQPIVPPLASSTQRSLAPVPFANSRAVPPPLAIVEDRSIADKPTLPTSPKMIEDRSIADKPTLPISPNERPDDTTLPYASKRLDFLAGAHSDPGIKRKYRPNEDSLLAVQGLISHTWGLQRFGLFVVADGMGGHANGQDASRLAAQKIIDTVVPKLVNNGTGSINFAQMLVDGIQNANQVVHQQNMEKRGDMGTTITLALVVGDSAYVANVGDSRTYLYSEPNGLRKLTYDHSVVASLVEAGIIKPDDIYTHPKRNQIYRSLGEKAHVDVDVFEEKLRVGDKLLLCSDGLWDMVRDPQIEDVIKRPVPHPSMTSEDLIRSALNGGGEDNVSVIVVQMMEGGDPLKLPRMQVLAMPDGVKLPPI